MPKGVAEIIHNINTKMSSDTFSPIHRRGDDNDDDTENRSVMSCDRLAPSPWIPDPMTRVSAVLESKSVSLHPMLAGQQTLSLQQSEMQATQLHLSGSLENILNRVGVVEVNQTPGAACMNPGYIPHIINCSPQFGLTTLHPSPLERVEDTQLTGVSLVTHQDLVGVNDCWSVRLRRISSVVWNSRQSGFLQRHSLLPPHPSVVF